MIKTYFSITNQRETSVIFDKNSGKPLHNAIVWQCRRGQKVCDEINSQKYKKLIKKRQAYLDTYFPALKLKELLNSNKKSKIN